MWYFYRTFSSSLSNYQYLFLPIGNYILNYVFYKFCSDNPLWKTWSLELQKEKKIIIGGVQP